MLVSTVTENRIQLHPWNHFWDFFTNIEQDLIYHNIHVPNTYILKTSTQQKVYKEFIFDIFKTQRFKFHYHFLNCMSQFCIDQVLVLNWERLPWDESIVSLLRSAVSVCSLLKNRKFCLKSSNKQTKNPLHRSLCAKESPEHEDGSCSSCKDFPSKPTRGLWRCRRSW